MQLTRFRVTHYRSILDSGWIELDAITAFIGQNEAGKSNLFEALYRLHPFAPDEAYDIDEDWPVDDWGNKDAAAVVCTAQFTLDVEESAALRAAAGNGTGNEALVLTGTRAYDALPIFTLEGEAGAGFDAAKVDAWAKRHVPRFVFIKECAFNGSRIDLTQLAARLRNTPWHRLGNEDRIAKTLLDLAQVNPDAFLKESDNAAAGTTHFFDKRAASAYLSRQFCGLWKQKAVGFHLEIDGTTLGIFAEDDAVGMPVGLHRRSSGFRWLAGFTWQFTQASGGRYADCVLLLEEPGIHLHFSGQRDLLDVLERLSADNTILYTTHLPALIDPFHPERIRSVDAGSESHGHTTVSAGISGENSPSLAVIEAALGLSTDMRALLGSRQTLLVQSGDDALILNKLSQILGSISKPHLAGRLYLWPTQGALQMPLYAALAASLDWNCGLLLDSDAQGRAAREQIESTMLAQASVEQAARLRLLSLGEAAGLAQQDASIEDLFDPSFYIDCVNTAFGIAIKETDLPADSGGLCRRVAQVLNTRYGHATLDRRRILAEMLRRIDGWEKLSDLPRGTSAKAEKLFLAINNAFGGRAERLQQQRA